MSPRIIWTHAWKPEAANLWCHWYLQGVILYVLAVAAACHLVPVPRAVRLPPQAQRRDAARAPGTRPQIRLLPQLQEGEAAMREKRPPKLLALSLLLGKQVFRRSVLFQDGFK